MASNWLRASCLIGLSILASAIGSVSASAQNYYGDGQRRGYERDNRDRRGGYDRRFERGDRRDRDFNRGGSGRRDAYEQHGRRPTVNPMQGMALEDQKRAVKNHREAQKKAIKRGYVIP
jgi:hypothetical protein